MGTNFLKIWIENYSSKKKLQMIWICPFKKKEKELKEDPNLVANGKF